MVCFLVYLPMNRDIALDRLKGIAVILMVISHVWLFQIPDGDTLSSIDLAIFLASRLCAPIFVFSFALVLTSKRNLTAVIKRSGYVLIAAIFLSLMMLAMTVAPYSVHILYVLALVSVLVPMLHKLSSKTCLALTASLFAVQTLFNLNVIDAPGLSLYLYGGELSSRLGLSFGVLTLMPYMFMGMYCYKVGEDYLALTTSKLSLGFLLAGIIIFIAEAYYPKTDSIYAMAGMNMMLISACLYLYHKLKNVPEMDSLLLPFGRHVLLVYLLHHFILFTVVISLGGAIQYGSMMKGEYVVRYSDAYLLLTSVLLLGLCHYVISALEHKNYRTKIKEAL